MRVSKMGHAPARAQGESGRWRGAAAVLVVRHGASRGREPALEGMHSIREGGRQSFVA